jgi:fluoroquinolone transport system permease protein
MKALLVGDVRFQFKYGFHFLYMIFAAVYTALLFVIPGVWREKAAILMIFSDPAAMGLYFMGSIVLFEKSERVLDSIAISPTKPAEYVLAKLGSIALISTVVALIIGICGGITGNLLAFAVGVFLCSCLFSSVGLIIAANITTLNQFIIYTIPAELVINIPAIAYLFGYKVNWLLLHPGVGLIELCANGPNAFLAMVGLILWSVLFFILACRVVQKMFQAVGGVKL